MPAAGLLLGGPRDAMVVSSNFIAYLGTQDGRLRAINVQTGTQVAITNILGNVVGAVALDGAGHVLAGTTLGRSTRSKLPATGNCAEQ